MMRLNTVIVAIKPVDEQTKTPQKIELRTNYGKRYILSIGDKVKLKHRENECVVHKIVLYKDWHASLFLKTDSTLQDWDLAADISRVSLSTIKRIYGRKKAKK